MHLLIGLGALIGLIAFALGEHAARVFATFVLVVMGVTALAVIYLVVVVGI